MDDNKNSTVTNRSAFINRQEEFRFLQMRLKEEPKNLLFLYGPKSGGKTTLLNHLVEHGLPPKEYEIKYLNFRQTSISSYQDFLRTLFGMDNSPGSSKKETKEKREYNFKIFKLSVETLKAIESKELDLFVVLREELKKLNRKGKTPVIIIDELQVLEGIYRNGQKTLLIELLNFFVSVTKELHLAHVILASSDGYFIETVYRDSKLRKTSAFYQIKYLSREDVLYWLNHLEKESFIREYELSQKQIQSVWEHFGGSPWEISRFLGDLLEVAHKGKIREKDFQKILHPVLIAARSLFYNYAGISEPQEKLFLLLHEKTQKLPLFNEHHLKELVQNKTYSLEDLRKELANLVRENFLAFNPITGEYELQGSLLKHGLKMYVEFLKELESE